MIVRRDEQLGHALSAVKPAVSRRTLTFLSVAGGVLCAILMLAVLVLAVRKHITGNQGRQGSPEDGSPMLPSTRDVVEVEAA